LRGGGHILILKKEKSKDFLNFIFGETSSPYVVPSLLLIDITTALDGYSNCLRV
jgi:hypothetical protein